MHTHQRKYIQDIPKSLATSLFDNSSQSESLQRKAGMTNNAAQRAEAPRPNNTGMPDNLKSGIESLSGFSMDDVRVHYNSSKPATVQALAYTQGTDIHVAPGQEKHLPHEAWHVAQQMAGRVSPTININGMPVNDNASLEHEADVMGEKAAQLKVSNEKGLTITVNKCVTQRAPHNKPSPPQFEKEPVPLDMFIRATGITFIDPKTTSFNQPKYNEFLNGAHIITKKTFYNLKYNLGKYIPPKKRGVASSHWHNNENGSLTWEGLLSVNNNEYPFKFGPIILDDENVPASNPEKYDNSPCYVQLEGAGNSSIMEHVQNFFKYKFTDYNVGPRGDSKYSEENDNPFKVLMGLRNYALPSMLSLSLGTLGSGILGALGGNLGTFESYFLGALGGCLGAWEGCMLGTLGGSLGELGGFLSGALGGSVGALCGGLLGTAVGDLGALGGALMGALTLLGGTWSFGLPGKIGKLPTFLGSALCGGILGGWAGSLQNIFGSSLLGILGLTNIFSGIFLKDLAKDTKRLVLDQNGTEMYIDHKTGERTYTDPAGNKLSINLAGERICTDSEGNKLYINSIGIYQYTNKEGNRLKGKSKHRKLKRIASTLTPKN